MNMRPCALTLTVALFALGAAASSLGNGFALDDLPLVQQNPRVRQLAPPWTYLAQTYWPPGRGPALYRPLTVAGFAVQWSLGRGAPLAFHLTNMMLYLLVALLVLAVARRLLPLPAAFGTALLFAVQPVHAEAVGSVVGQAELWAALFSLVAVDR